MKVLITGGSGFVGSHLADRLLANQHEVLVIDNYATGRRDNLTAHSSLKIVEGSIVDQGLVDQLFDSFRPDMVVHAAASYKDSEDFVGDAATNTLGTANIIMAAKRTGVKRIIYFQTALCYGIHPQEQPITLNHHRFPGDTSYAISKTAGEYYIEISGIDFVTFRLANAYGPRNISGPLPTFFHRLTQNKPCFVMDTRRDFVYIDDLIDCVMLAVEGKGQGAYHISSGSDVEIKALYDGVIEALGITPDQDVEVRPRHEDDAASILLSPERTFADFGWKTKTALYDGIAKTIEYYQQYGITQTYTHLTQPVE